MLSSLLPSSSKATMEDLLRAVEPNGSAGGRECHLDKNVLSGAAIDLPKPSMLCCGLVPALTCVVRL